MVQNEEIVATIYSNTLEDMSSIIKDLGTGEDVNGWENGLGETVFINVEKGQPKMKRIINSN